MTVFILMPTTKEPPPFDVQVVAIDNRGRLRTMTYRERPNKLQDNFGYYFLLEQFDFWYKEIELPTEDNIYLGVKDVYPDIADSALAVARYIYNLLKP